MTSPRRPAPIHAIPVVDVRGYMAGARDYARRAAEEIRTALERVGFFVVTGHGLDWSLLDATYREMKRFFDLPVDVKATVEINGTFEDARDKRGYMGFAADAYGAARANNRVESYYFEHEEGGKNRWPSDLPGFRQTILSYLKAVDGLAFQLLPLFAMALDLPEDYFTPFFLRPMVGLRAAHYPPASGAVGEWGLMPHTDRGFMTLLPANDVPGLQIRPENEDWIDAPYVPEAFIVNSGDILKRWTNDRFLSTPHRVVPPSHHRYSIPYFYAPVGDKILEPLRSCVSKERPARYEPVSFDAFTKAYFRKDYEYKDPRLAG